jgi:hypothetical protein
MPRWLAATQRRLAQPLRRLGPAVLFAMAAGSAACGAHSHPRPSVKPCKPECLATSACAELDTQLIEARRPLLKCVGEQARRGNLVGAHRCYRALRLLESARWWLKTLMGTDELHTVYMPSETIKNEFLCRIEALTRAQTPAEVERLYLDMIRSYP